MLGNATRKYYIHHQNPVQIVRATTSFKRHSYLEWLYCDGSRSSYSCTPTLQIKARSWQLVPCNLLQPDSSYPLDSCLEAKVDGLGAANGNVIQNYFHPSHFNTQLVYLIFMTSVHACSVYTHT